MWNENAIKLCTADGRVGVVMQLKLSPISAAQVDMFILIWPGLFSDNKDVKVTCASD